MKHVATGHQICYDIIAINDVLDHLFLNAHFHACIPCKHGFRWPSPPLPSLDFNTPQVMHFPVPFHTSVASSLVCCRYARIACWGCHEGSIWPEPVPEPGRHMYDDMRRIRSEVLLPFCHEIWWFVVGWLLVHWECYELLEECIRKTRCTIWPPIQLPEEASASHTAWSSESRKRGRIRQVWGRRSRKIWGKRPGMGVTAHKHQSNKYVLYGGS